MTPSENHKLCLNCGAPMEAEQLYCGKCGQRARSNPLPLREFIGDFFSDYFTVDAKAFRSVKQLILYPGLMTRCFNNGQRLSYIAPFRLYIFTSFVYFFLLALSTDDSDLGFINTDQKVPEIQLAQIDSLMADTANTDMARLRNLYESIREQNPDSVGDAFPNYVIEIDEEQARDSPITALINDRWKRAKENPERFRQGLFKSVSIGVFFLLPIFAFILMLTHLRRSEFYVDHLVLSVHFHTFLFLVFCVYLLLDLWSSQVTHWVLFAITLWYFGIAVRKVWQEPPRGWFKKSVAILFFVLFLFVVIIPSILGDPSETDVYMVVAVASVYFTLALMNAYNQSFLKSMAKHILIAPVYSVVIMLTLALVAIAGIIIS